MIKKWLSKVIFGWYLPKSKKKRIQLAVSETDLIQGAQEETDNLERLLGQRNWDELLDCLRTEISIKAIRKKMARPYRRKFKIVMDELMVIYEQEKASIDKILAKKIGIELCRIAQKGMY